MSIMTLTDSKIMTNGLLLWVDDEIELLRAHIIFLEKKGYEVVEAKIVTNSDMHAMNTFDAPETVTEKDFTDYTMKDNGLQLVIPKNSVMEIRLQKK